MIAQPLKKSTQGLGPAFAMEDRSPLECLVELRADDSRTGVQYRDCQIDYTACPNHRCIKKLV